MKNLVRLPLVIVVVLTLPCTLASGEVYLVPTDFPTIQSAIDFATDNDEIIVGSGVYTGTGAQVIDMSGKALWLHSSDGPEATIIDGEGARRGIVCVMGEASDSKIEGFTIQNCRMTDNGGGGMYILESSPTLTNCRFRTNHAFFGGGIFSDHGSPTLEGCKFENNVADGHGGGMNNSDSRPILANCVFEGNSGSEGGGMMNTQTSNPLLINCRISNNNGGGIYNYHQFTTATLAGTVVCGNDSYQIAGPGDWIDYGGNCITETCADDINHNGVPDECECPADVNGDGVVNIDDIFEILAHWGPCD